LAGQPVVVAAGDSFTFGDEVGDAESWPSILEQGLAQRVLNVGVFGYGLDQTYLRARNFARLYRPRILIVSMVSDDITRTELAYRNAWKPYFELDGPTIRLKNTPVPEGALALRMPRLRGLLRYSHAAHAIFRRVAPLWWRHDGERLYAHHNGDQVGCAIMQQIARQLAPDMRVLILGQAGKFYTQRRLDPVMDCARASGLEVLDLADAIRRRFETAPDLKARWISGGGHLTAEANRWTAMKIQEVIRPWLRVEQTESAK
jgi:hypothetical protein